MCRSVLRRPRDVRYNSGGSLQLLVVDWVAYWLAHSTFKRDIMVSNPDFQTSRTPSSYSTCPGLSIKWTGRRLVTDSSTMCAWVVHVSKAVKIHIHNNRRCLYVPRVPGSVKNPHNNNNQSLLKWTQIDKEVKEICRKEPIHLSKVPPYQLQAHSRRCLSGSPTS